MVLPESLLLWLAANDAAKPSAACLVIGTSHFHDNFTTHQKNVS
jgi:hypothetical protein